MNQRENEYHFIEPQSSTTKVVPAGRREAAVDVLQMWTQTVTVSIPESLSYSGGHHCYYTANNISHFSKPEANFTPGWM